jgi:acyl carrier protein
MSDDAREVEERLERFIRKHFRVSDDDPRFSTTVDLYEGGFVDSVGVVELLAFIDDAFGVEVPEGELLSQDFSTVEGIARIVAALS